MRTFATLLACLTALPAAAEPSTLLFDGRLRVTLPEDIARTRRYEPSSMSYSTRSVEERWRAAGEHDALEILVQYSDARAGVGAPPPRPLDCAQLSYADRADYPFAALACHSGLSVELTVVNTEDARATSQALERFGFDRAAPLTPEEDGWLDYLTELCRIGKQEAGDVRVSRSLFGGRWECNLGPRVGYGYSYESRRIIYDPPYLMLASGQDSAAYGEGVVAHVRAKQAQETQPGTTVFFLEFRFETEVFAKGALGELPEVLRSIEVIK